MNIRDSSNPNIVVIPSGAEKAQIILKSFTAMEYLHPGKRYFVCFYEEESGQTLERWTEITSLNTFNIAVEKLKTCIGSKYGIYYV